METGHSGIIAALISRGYRVSLYSFSALDNYLEIPGLPFVFIETNADIADLAGLADDIRFPGTDIADAAADSGGRRWYFRSRDADEPVFHPSYKLLSLSLDLKTLRFIDALGVYATIRSLKNRETVITGWWEDLYPGTGSFKALTDGALIVARYRAAEYPPADFIDMLTEGIASEPPPCAEIQKTLLIGLMTSPAPERGLEFLKASGFLEQCWPEISRLDSAIHSKEFHPEGNAWNHTLQTFGYRKPNSQGEYDPRLSLALLLHDIGKPLSEGSGGRRFDGHAELGAGAASRFLRRLDFDPGTVDDVFYLVKNHMLPAALARLSPAKTGDVMNSPLFPSLMELYRCDESSSFKGLDNFYENSAAYQAYLKNSRNPYRSASGKILGQIRGRKRFF